MDNQRYKLYMKENNQTLAMLSNSYQRLATSYVKKARGYAVKSIDTELKIKDVLQEILEIEERRIAFLAAIPDETAFVESRINQLSKRLPENHLKSIISIAFVILFFTGWIGVNCWLQSKNYFDAPKNLTVVLRDQYHIDLVWDEVEFATEGYIAYFIDQEGHRGAEREVSERSCSFQIAKGKTYTFYVYVKGTDFYGKSKVASIKYPA